MAPFGFKLWENAFQMIPDVSFFDAESVKKNGTNIKIKIEKIANFDWSFTL